jgi:hypothetical protein
MLKDYPALKGTPHDMSAPPAPPMDALPAPVPVAAADTARPAA